MAAPVRRTDPSVAEVFAGQPWEFQFFQAVRLLAWIYPGRRLISGLNQPHSEIVRFHAHQSLAFPASEIQEIELPKSEREPLHMTVNFLGLTGPLGALPAHYTEYLMGRAHVGDEAAAAFFDLFNHRLVALFYLAWEKHHFPIGFERESLSPAAPRRFTQYLFDLIGMGTAGLTERVDFAQQTLLSYAGLIAQRPHSAVALEGLLEDHFQVPVRIQQFIGHWWRLEPESLSWLDGAGVHGQLGLGAIAGDQVWNPQARFRIQLGPLSWKRFNQFLPGGGALSALIAITQYFVNQALEFDVQLILRAAEVPPCEASDDPGGPRLGLSTWLKTEPFQRDAADAQFSLRSTP